jgi:ketosteroid isomerase-like protein
MQSWVGKKLVNHQLKALRNGDVKPTLRMDSRKVELHFPGDNSWSGVIKGKKAHRDWLERFCVAGMQIFADEVVVKGTPWNSRVMVRGTDHLDDADGNRVYENRYVIWGTLRFGKLHRYEVYEDTKKVGALDDWMERTGHPAAPSAVNKARPPRRRLRRAA